MHGTRRHFDGLFAWLAPARRREPRERSAQAKRDGRRMGNASRMRASTSGVMWSG